jgi:hypothetical protein
VKTVNNGKDVSAAKVTCVTFGVLAGLGGLYHGIGEILQGNIRPEGLVIDSWTQGPIATHMGGEPGMTLIPNLPATGIIDVIVSLAVIVWAIFFVKNRNGGLVLAGLSIAMMLVGGGFGPPVMGILAGIAGMGAGGGMTWWRNHLAGGIRRSLAVCWPWVYGLAAASGTLLVIGSLILVFLFDVNNSQLFVNIFFATVVLLILTAVTGIGYDTRPERHRQLAAEDIEAWQKNIA